MGLGHRFGKRGLGNKGETKVPPLGACEGEVKNLLLSRVRAGCQEICRQGHPECFASLLGLVGSPKIWFPPALIAAYRAPGWFIPNTIPGSGAILLRTSGSTFSLCPAQVRTSRLRFRLHRPPCRRHRLCAPP